MDDTRQTTHFEVNYCLMGHSDRAHATLSPSSMSRVTKCPGSVILSEGIVSKVSDAAREGTLAHEAAEYYLRLLFNLDPDKSKLAECSAEMKELSLDYATFCKELHDDLIKEGYTIERVYIENKVIFSDQIWGTADFAVVGRKNDNLRVVFNDFKFGRYPVKVYSNPQLLTYLACLDQQYKRETGEFIDSADLYIYQPRTKGDPHEHWAVDAKTIKDWVDTLNDLEATIKTIRETGDIRSHLHVGDMEHCTFCPAKSKCPEFVTDKTMKALLALDEMTPHSPQELSLDEKIEIYKKKKAIELFLNAVEKDVVHTAEVKPISGYKIETKPGKRKWRKDTESIAKQLRVLGIENPFKAPELLPITEVEKQLIGTSTEIRGMMDNLVERTREKKVLVEDDVLAALD